MNLHSGLERSARRAFPSIAAALALMLGQLIFALSCSPVPGIRESYFRLNQWDSGEYAIIVGIGYMALPDRMRWGPATNVTKFPAYPLLALALKSATGIRPSEALLITSQVCCFLFWLYAFLLMDRWKIPPMGKALAALSIAAFPSAFYMVAGYSESLFMASTLGLVYWATRRRTRIGWLAIAHGFTMSACRIVGIPLLLALIAKILPRPGYRASRPLIVRTIAACAAMSAGGLLFFAYSEWKFGVWDLYIWSAYEGWNVRMEWASLFMPSTWRLLSPSLENPDSLGPLSNAAMAVFLFCLLAIEAALWRERKNSRLNERLVFYLMAAVMLAIYVGANASSGMKGVLRYNLTTHMALVCAATHLSRQVEVRGMLARGFLSLAAIAAIIAGVWVQRQLLTRFLSGLWVA